MGVLLVVPVGPDLEPAMVGMRGFPVSKIVLVSDPKHPEHVEQVQRVLTPLGIETDVRPVEGEPVMGMVRLLTTVLAEEKGKWDDIYINTSSGSALLNHGALCAAYVNGAKGFYVADNKAWPMPILRFSYHELVSDSKLQILKALEDAGNSVGSLQELSERSGVDKSLLSYHIRGSRDVKGLEDLGLVAIERGQQGRLLIRLTGMGRMILKGRNGVAATAVQPPPPAAEPGGT